MEHLTLGQKLKLQERLVEIHKKKYQEKPIASRKLTLEEEEKNLRELKIRMGIK